MFPGDDEVSAIAGDVLGILRLEDTDEEDSEVLASVIDDSVNILLEGEVYELAEVIEIFNEPGAVEGTSVSENAAVSVEIDEAIVLE